ncbi:GntR family transcriptional regulator [Mesorhizobium sp. B4-1-4]|uniref:GntR family transcriptional regulator n=1 Tax=Mesorhizobium sp. B4-1-4 TaxID=2589888 RepID=UPI001128CC00|nr:GntR family transcriptional regulator [Mesorhizobium sp. B4-1-4]UCI31828.1 GntR family transcriptional regulator [Mesorhizobium sp. B4-1-4]
MRELSRANLASRAYAEIRKELIAGQFEPGEALKLRELSERLGTSQTPVREALMKLAAERALIVEPGRSPRVPNLTLARFVELRDMRVALETLAGKGAAENATPSLTQELRSLHERLLRAKNEARFKETLALNRSFHFVLYKAAGRDILVAMIESLWVQTGPYLNFLYPGTVAVSDTSHPHARILAGLEAKDASIVATAIEEDIVYGGRPVVDHLIGLKQDDVPHPVSALPIGKSREKSLPRIE